MVDADEGGVGDDVERLLAAIVRMGAPADVGEQAGGVAQALLLRVSSMPVEAMNRSVQSASSSPWRGERERSTLSSCAAAISGSRFFSFSPSSE